MLLTKVSLSQKDLLKAKVKEFEADCYSKGMNMQFQCSFKCFFGLYLFVSSIFIDLKHQYPVFDKRYYQ